MIIGSIDPGKLNLPFALWWDDELTAAALSQVEGVRDVNALARLHAANVCTALGPVIDFPERIYVEQMQLTQGRDKTRRQAIAKGNDLIAISNIAASVAAALGAELIHVPIGTWKGTAPKHVTEARVRKTLGYAELHILDEALSHVKQSLHHNLYDACGIGLHATGRYRVR